MITARLRSNGVSPRRVGLIIGEMWLVFALWIGVLWAAAAQLAPNGGVSGFSDFQEMARRFGHLAALGRILTIASLAAGLGVFVHFLSALNRAMQSPGENEEP